MFFLLDRYILRIFLVNLIGLLALFSSLFMAIDCIPILSRFDVNLETVFRYYFHLLPEIIYIITPAASLIASILCLYQLNKTQEMTAFFSLGLSFFRICLPILSFLTLLSFSLLWWNEKILPHFTQKKDYIYFIEIKKKPNQYSAVKANKIWFRSNHIIFNIQSLNLRQSKAQGLTFYFFNKNWSLTQLIKAKEMHIENNRWTLTHGRSTVFIQDSKHPLTKSFNEKVLNIDENIADLQFSSKAIKNMSLSQIKALIEKNKKSGLDTFHYELEYHKKISFSFTTLITSLLGMLLILPFKKRRILSGKHFFNPGACILILALYWILMMSLMNLGEHAILHPILATWGAPIIALIFSIFLLSKKRF